MGILAPLFLAALAGLALPVLFHVARKVPSGRREFSSLLFLSPTPPRLTRRSRLDQIILLLLRLAALALLVFAFARPFLRESSILTLSDLPRRRVAILLDASASMRREDLWQQALAAVGKELDEAAPHDELALFTFGDRLRVETPFPATNDRIVANANSMNEAMPAAGVALPAGATAERIRQQLAQLRPTWEAGDLGSALATLAAELDASGDVRQSLAQPIIIAIGDFSRSERLETLQNVEWPARVRVAIRKLSTKTRTNASLQLLVGDGDSEYASQAAAGSGESTERDAPRVRVSNSADSTGDQFYLRWQEGGGGIPRAAVIPEVRGSAPPNSRASSGSGAEQDGELAVQVPPGESRVVRLPRPKQLVGADRIVLRGDDHSFDNTHFVSPQVIREVTLAYLGDDADNDPQGWRYYLRLATADDPLRRVTLASGDEAWKLLAGPLAPKLVVVTTSLAPDQVALLRTVARQGSVVALVPGNQSAFQSHLGLLDDPPGNASASPDVSLTSPAKPDSVVATEVVSDGVKVAKDAFFLVGQIEFTHPLFAPFASPRYNDFTRIHFWRRHEFRRAPGDSTRVLASFDDGRPWIVERRAEKGSFFLATSGWNPDDSQWAVSTKFVPMISAWLDLAAGATRPMPSVEVGSTATLPLPVVAGVILRRPDGKQNQLMVGATEVRETDEPGVYTVESGGTVTRFAVNVAARESDTAPLDLDRLEQLGVMMGGVTARVDQLERLRQERDHELEGRQQAWRWLIIACLVTLLVETWWGGRRARQSMPRTEPA